MDHTAYNYRNWQNARLNSPFIKHAEIFDQSDQVKEGIWNPPIAKPTQYVSSSYIQHSESSECAGVILNNVQESMQWDDLDCNSLSFNSMVVCETYDKKQQNIPTSLKWEHNAHFCPSRWTFIGSHCFRMISINSRNKDICNNLGGEIFTFNYLTNISYFRMYEDIFKKLLKDKTHSFYMNANSQSGCIILKWSSSQRDWVSQTLNCDFAFNISENVLCEQTLMLFRELCHYSQFQCLDKTCILDKYVCDGEHDCLNGEDEWYCDNCSHSFSSLNKNCYHPSRRNTYTAPTCRYFDYKCLSGECISYDFVCDCKQDCSDGSDEFCHSDICYDKICSQYKGEDALRDQYIHFLNKSSVGEYSRSLCTLEEVTLCTESSSECYLRDKVCIYETYQDQHIGSCQTGAHLQGCGNFECPGMFQCQNGSGYCVPYKQVCDSIVDCPSGQDEHECPPFRSCPGMLKCKADDICVHPRDQGDGIINCPMSADDEFVCHDVLCPEMCQCFGKIMVCTGGEKQLPAVLSRSINALFLVNNSLQSVNLHDLACNYLLGLDLSYNAIDTTIWSENINCNNLVSLHISHNNIGNLIFNKSKSLSSLVKLDFSFNFVSVLTKESFRGVPNLMEVNASYCAIHVIQFDALVSLVKIQTIDLSNNFLHSLPSEYLSNLINLRSFYIQNNWLIFSIGDVDLFSMLDIRYLDADPESLLCCFIKAHKRVCVQTPGSNTCQKRLLNNFVPYLLTIESLLIVFLNMVTMLYHFISQFSFLKAPIITLATFNTLIGIYVAGLIISDHHTSSNFYFYKNKWMESSICKTGIFISTIALVGNAMQCFYLAYVTYHGVTNVQEGWHKKINNKKRKKCIIICGLTWMVSCLTGYFMIQKVSDINFSTTLCLPFTSLALKITPAIVIRTIIEGCLYLAALILHACMLIYVRKVETASKRMGAASYTHKYLQLRVFLHLSVNASCFLVDMFLLAYLRFTKEKPGSDWHVYILATCLPIHALFNPVNHTFAARQFIRFVVNEVTLVFVKLYAALFSRRKVPITEE